MDDLTTAYINGFVGETPHPSSVLMMAQKMGTSAFSGLNGSGSWLQPGLNVQRAKLLRRHQVRRRKRFISKYYAAQYHVGTEDKRWIVNDLRDQKCVAAHPVNSAFPQVNESRYRGNVYIHVFCAKEILGEFGSEFKEEAIWAASLVPQHRGHDVLIA